MAGGAATANACYAMLPPRCYSSDMLRQRVVATRPPRLPLAAAACCRVYASRPLLRGICQRMRRCYATVRYGEARSAGSPAKRERRGSSGSAAPAQQ